MISDIPVHMQFLRTFSGVALAVLVARYPLVAQQATRVATPAATYRSGLPIASATGDSVREARVSAFLRDLSRELPRLAALNNDTAHNHLGTWVGNWVPKQESRQHWLQALGRPMLSRQNARSDWASKLMQPDVSLWPLAWLDSLRVLWPQMSERARAEGFLGAEMPIVVPVLLELAEQRIALATIREFGTAAQETAKGTARYTADGDMLMSSGRFLVGAVLLAQGDTVQALPLLLDAARMPMLRIEKAYVSGPAGRILSDIAEVRHDTTRWIQALAIQRLHHATSWQDAKSMVVDARLRELYGPYVAGHGTPPDVDPDRLAGEPGPRMPLSLDAYLDRQWAILFDRNFPVEPVSSVVPRSETGRLVVVEHGTRYDCGACFEHERILSGIVRRYARDNVVALTFQTETPVVDLTSGLQERRSTWVPNEQFKTVIPFRAMVTATGDTLRSEVFVDGRRGPLLWRPDHMVLSYLNTNYRDAVRRVDEALARQPDARVRLQAELAGSRMLAQITVDSVRGLHRTLALRVALVEDTVWTRMGTIRRIFPNVVRAEAHGDSLPLGFPLPAQPSVTIRATFDVAAIQAGVLMARDADAMLRARYNHWGRKDLGELRDTYAARYPDMRDWTIDRSRLFLVAMVQDLETGEILQAARANASAGMAAR